MAHDQPPVKISCRHLWKVFGDDPQGFLRRHEGAPDAAAFRRERAIGACQDISFDVRAGEIMMVMGLSGSGKSTLVRCLTRLIEPTDGQAMFDGRDLLSASASELIDIRRHKIGMVFQHFGLLGHRTVLDNIAFPLEIQGIPREQREAKAREIVRTVGLEGRETYFPGELSGGQQQRVGIARSLAVDPEAWFLDEPFSALDPLIRREMQDEFLRLQRQLHKTIVFITHDFDEAVRLGDRIVILRDGRIEQIGTPEELVLSPANDYVAQFTRDAPRADLIRAATVMEPAAGGGAPETGVPGDAALSRVAAQVLASELPTPVLDEAGGVVGQLSRDTVIRELFDTAAQPGQAETRA